MPKFIESLNSASTAVIVTDMINIMIDKESPFYVPKGKQIAVALNEFLSWCREKNILVIYASTAFQPGHIDMSNNNRDVLKQYDVNLFNIDNDNTDIVSDCAPSEKDIQITKQFYSSFYGTNLDAILRANHITTVAIAGLCTDTACHATARDAFYLDYDVIVFSDLTATKEWPDCGYGAVSEEISQKATLNNLFSTNSDVFTSEHFKELIE